MVLVVMQLPFQISSRQENKQINLKIEMVQKLKRCRG
jgi:hypothetical protein